MQILSGIYHLQAVKVLELVGDGICIAILGKATLKTVLLHPLEHYSNYIFSSFGLPASLQIIFLSFMLKEMGVCDVPWMVRSSHDPM